ncbi:thiamine pyrophosphokinase 1-like isoform X1 [Gossypium australe]|uniref:Thiamine pyrophosphokinase 1-like isoform X1 n=1 Tax=Gossypium australe TaxID=47621 RepID=A0A5B6V065_9ROSI|nr:thiamine pyrophosphokinase 1-like isoform X1 [Gossypium australe]
MDSMHHSSCFLLPTIPLQRRPSLTTAQLHLCADGGANRLYDEMPLFFPQEDASHVRRRYKPDVIKGDMDSIRREVLEFYASLGTEIVDKSHDQDTTDLHKCVTYIRDSALGLDKSNVS